ncbi:unnamed protein product [Caenorhabditis angaria]|uniref:Uncharacterized protein n=1 Tax=Caenorhabditis angaria TaxID=860376 RepID=A0A9P1IA83_9PELO|nr:unnamed protein product [Caenorhabditis angaria]
MMRTGKWLIIFLFFSCDLLIQQSYGLRRIVKRSSGSGSNSASGSGSASGSYEYHYPTNSKSDSRSSSSEETLNVPTPPTLGTTLEEYGPIYQISGQTTTPTTTTTTTVQPTQPAQPT